MSLSLKLSAKLWEKMNACTTLVWWKSRRVPLKHVRVFPPTFKGMLYTWIYEHLGIPLTSFVLTGALWVEWMEEPKWELPIPLKCTLMVYLLIWTLAIKNRAPALVNFIGSTEFYTISFSEVGHFTMSEKVYTVIKHTLWFRWNIPSCCDNQPWVPDLTLSR